MLSNISILICVLLKAPDFPGFGFTEIPESRAYEFTTANIVQTMEAFLDTLEVKSFSIYLHDFGAPVGMRFVYYSAFHEL